jgi:hypothetical protein
MKLRLCRIRDSLGILPEKQNKSKKAKESLEKCQIKLLKAAIGLK